MSGQLPSNQHLLPASQPVGVAAVCSCLVAMGTSQLPASCQPARGPKHLVSYWFRIAAEAPLRVLLLQLLVACQPAQEFSSSDGSVSIVAGAHQQARTHPAQPFIARRCVRVATQGVLARWRERLCSFHKHLLTACTWGKSRLGERKITLTLRSH